MLPQDLQQQIRTMDHVGQGDVFPDGVHVPHAGAEHTGDDSLFKENIGIGTAYAILFVFVIGLFTVCLILLNRGVGIRE